VRITDELRERKIAAPDWETNIIAEGIRCSDHATFSTRKFRHYFAESGGPSVCTFRLRTKSHGVFYSDFASFQEWNYLLSLFILK
jgi:hypothetical protein